MALDYIAHKEAEKLAGIKLDGRRRYYLWNGIVQYTGKFTTGCSGCIDDSEYSSATIGSGCSECGYTGKRVIQFPIPANPKQFIA